MLRTLFLKIDHTVAVKHFQIENVMKSKILILLGIADILL